MSNSSSEEEEYDSNSKESSETKQGGRTTNSITTTYIVYTDEQKIVSAVWMHERPYNYQTIEDVQNNFRIRFKMEPPGDNTLSKWEKRLFSSGAIVKERKRRPLERLIHVPYVKASLRDKPGLSFTERACQLGLSTFILRQILKYDIKESDLHQEKDTSSQFDAIDNGEIQIKEDLSSD